MGCRVVLSGFLVALASVGVVQAAMPLDAAKSLAATRFKDWTYGSNPKKMEIDCVQFVLAAAEESLGRSLDETVRKGILISNLSPAESKPSVLGALVEADDDRTKGIQSALVGAGLGLAVAPPDARAGDFIQYWMKQSDGTWFGHAGLVHEVSMAGKTPQATIYGSHKSQDGIAVSKFRLRLTGDRADRRIYLVRLKTP
jgi:hypothetical protein